MRTCLRSGRSRSVYLFIRRAIKQILAILEPFHFCQIHTKCYPTSCCQSYLHMQSKLLGSPMWISTQHVSWWTYIVRSANTWGKNGNIMNPCISYLQDFKNFYDSLRKDVLCHILIEFGITMREVKVKVKCTLVQTLRLCTGRTTHRVVEV